MAPSSAPTNNPDSSSLRLGATIVVGIEILDRAAGFVTTTCKVGSGGREEMPVDSGRK